MVIHDVRSGPVIPLHRGFLSLSMKSDDEIINATVSSGASMTHLTLFNK